MNISAVSTRLCGAVSTAFVTVMPLSLREMGDLSSRTGSGYVPAYIPNYGPEEDRYERANLMSCKFFPVLTPLLLARIP